MSIAGPWVAQKQVLFFIPVTGFPFVWTNLGGR